jgi:hypothetical protein
MRHQSHDFYNRLKFKYAIAYVGLFKIQGQWQDPQANGNPLPITYLTYEYIDGRKFNYLLYNLLKVAVTNRHI